MSRPNWFFAFPIPGGFVSELPPLPPRFRRFHPDDVHLTLTFLGGCGEQAAERALHALDELLVSSSQRPIDVSLGEVTRMGHGRAYSALSALLAGGREETERYMGATRDALTEAALGRREKRAPKAHVTLARPLRNATETHRQAGLAWAAALDLRSVHATLDRIALYTWPEERRDRLFRIVAERRIGV